MNATERLMAAGNFWILFSFDIWLVLTSLGFKSTLRVCEAYTSNDLKCFPCIHTIWFAHIIVESENCKCGSCVCIRFVCVCVWVNFDWTHTCDTIKHRVLFSPFLSFILPFPYSICLACLLVVSQCLLPFRSWFLARFFFVLLAKTTICNLCANWTHHSLARYKRSIFRYFIAACGT